MGSSMLTAASSSIDSSSTRAPTTAEPTTPSTTITTGVIAGIAGGVALILIVVGLFGWKWCTMRRTKKLAYLEQNDNEHYVRANSPIDHQYQPNVASTTANMWEDPVIVFSRVPREKVNMGPLISSGGFGNVYRGTFNNEPVAIKMLLETSRQDVKHVNAFLSEAKLMATSQQECNVKFIGVAWDSLNDICVLSEFMAGGDLRNLLNKCQTNGHPTGLDHSKLDIAYQVSFALTYLHSLSPPIIHRDLKSRNVLLSEDHSEAELTDFGVSRQRADRTMTAGIGTLLWMAPELMTGERYDEKADVFSFGVLLAELDTHELPYAHARSSGMSGARMADSPLVAKIASGALQVQFSTANTTLVTKCVVELEMQCISLTPSNRPTAAQVLYRLQCALKELPRGENFESDTFEF